MPEVMRHLAYYELSTPLSTDYFTRAAHGAIYGLETTPQRFTNLALRTRTPLPNLYMAGVDVTAPGVVGAMTSGMLAAATIEPRIYVKLL